MSGKVVAIRLSEEEIAMARKHGKNLSDAIRKLIYGTPPTPMPPLPSFAEVLDSGGYVTMSDGSGEYALVRPGDAPPVRRETTIDHNYPAIQTAARAEIRSLAFWSLSQRREG